MEVLQSKPTTDISSKCPKVLLVDDEESVLLSLERFLRNESVDIHCVTSPIEALELVSHCSFAVVVADLRMPKMDGIELLERIQQISPETIRMMLTADAQIQVVANAVNRGKVHNFFTKPWCRDTVRNAVRQAVNQYELARKNRHLQMLNTMQATDLNRLNKRLQKKVSELAQAQETITTIREQEIEIGSRIQKTLLVESPPDSLPGVRLAHKVQPSESIDGDFLDFFQFSDTCFDILVGDVMGKGVPAALLGAAIKSQFMRSLSSLYSESSDEPPSIASIINYTNRAITEELIELESYVTLFYARFDLKAKTISYVGCGHPPGILFRGDKGIQELLQGKHMPLGFSHSELYASTTVPLKPGDSVFLYSDGLTEMRNEKGEFFGQENLMQCLRKTSWHIPELLIEEVYSQVTNFSAPHSFADDLTCIAIQIEAPRLQTPIVFSEKKFTSSLCSLKPMRQTLRNFTTPYFNDKQICELELALTEAATNIIQHVHQSFVGETIDLEFVVFPDRAVMLIRYKGEPFDQTTVSLPVFDGSKDSGFGLFIISQMVDEVHYINEQTNNNCIYMTKNFKEKTQ